MKRLLFFFALLALMSIMPLRAQTGTKFDIDGITYTAFTDSTVAVSSDWLEYLLDDTVVIPEWVFHEGSRFRVTRLATNAFYAQTAVREFVLPTSIHTLPENCFYECRFQYITLPSELDSIMDGALEVESLKDVYIPASVKYIHPQALFGTMALTDIEVDSNNLMYRSIEGALYSIDSTLLLVYPPGKENAFFTVPEGVTRLGFSAFMQNPFLQTVDLPESLNEIGEQAFIKCTSLTDIRLPRHARLVSNAFAWCPALRNIEIDSANPYIRFLPSDTAIVSMNGDTLFYKVMNCPTITVPEGVRYVAPYALAYNFASQWMIIREGVEEIADHGCYNSNARVSLPHSLRKIGERAFSWSGMTSVSMQEGVQEIGEDAFSYCFHLGGIVLPSSLKTISRGAFAVCSQMRTLAMGDSVEFVGDSAFIHCRELRNTDSLTFPPTLHYLGTSAFENTRITAVKFTGPIDTVGARAFAVGGDKLASLTLNQQQPPIIGEDPFEFASEYTIFIPCGSLSNYLDAPVWDGYRNYEEDCDGVEPIDGEAVTVRGGAGHVMVAGAAGQRVEVYNVTGVRVTAGTATADPQAFRVPAAGIYLVRVADLTYRAAVR